MERYFGSESVKHPFRNAVIALGNFDGMHLGHQYIISKTIELAKRHNGLSVVYTFNPHPVKILAPDSCPPLIQTLEQRLASLEELKIDICVVENFTHEFAKQTAQQFFEHILMGRLGGKVIIVGYDFTFGYHRSGTIELLETLGRKRNVEVVVIEARFVGDLLLSSTDIRRFISAGHVEDAKKMLGRPFKIEGKVVAGKGIGGYLGAHTANIEPANELVPGDGVYLTVTYIKNPPNPPLKKGGMSESPPLKKGGEGGIWPSVTSIGHNPTFPGGPLSNECSPRQAAGYHRKTPSPLAGEGWDEGDIRSPSPYPLPSRERVSVTPQRPPKAGQPQAEAAGNHQIETHLIGFDGSLLGEIIAVEFLKKMRDQIAFPSVEKLHEQIVKDVEEARVFHEKNRTL